MIHYHGTPITPADKLLALAGRSFCVRYGAHGQIETCHRIGESVMIDNGAYSFWTKGEVVEWRGYYEWVEPWLDYPTTWAVIPDVIDGGEAENDALLLQWPFGQRGAPVWHMDEPIGRLLRLCARYQRVCLGSSGEYAVVGDQRWHRRMDEAMNALCGNGPVPRWLHMLRGMALAGSHYPFASADSTDVARNHAGTNGGRPRRDPAQMAQRIGAKQCPARWEVVAELAELPLA